MNLTDVVVVNYRTPRDLERFGKSFEEFGSGKLWVVNVAPTTEDAVVSGNLGCTILTTDSNVGYARACNQAAKRGEGDIIAFFNADTVLTPGVIDGCSDLLRENPNWGVAGPRQVDGQGRLTHAGIFGTDTAPQHRGWLAKRGFEDVRDDCYSVSGAAYFVKRSVWEALTNCPLYRDAVAKWNGEVPLGAFLPTDLWYEETWCSVHARAHGYAIAYVGSYTMRHDLHGAGSVKRGPRLMERSKAFFVAACEAHGLEHN